MTRRKHKLQVSMRCIMGIVLIVVLFQGASNIFFISSFFNETPQLFDEKLLDHCLKKDQTEHDDPCASPQSLTSFLKKQAPIFSKYNPICPDSAKNRVHIAIPFDNVQEINTREAVQLALRQKYPKKLLHIWVFENGSRKSSEFSRICCGDENVFDISPVNNGYNEDKIYASRYVNNLNLKADDIPPLLCFRSTQHLGRGEGKYWLFRLVHAVAEPNDVVITLDGDDLLLPGAVQIINQKYVDDASWFTYGSYKGKWSDKTQPLPMNVKSASEKLNPQDDTWRYGHPRSFKAHLLNNIDQTDFTHLNGSWPNKASDHSFIYKMLELAGVDRISYIPQIMYDHKQSTKTSTLAVDSNYAGAVTNQHTQILKPASKLELPIHIILLTWKRIELLQHQLKWLHGQTGLDNRKIHLHIVNNNWDERHTVDDIVTDFGKWQLFNKQTKANYSIAHTINVTVTHTDKDDPFHCFARFIYVNQLRRSTPLDSVIFVDDDHYWVPTFVAALLKEHKPKGMTTWYGKIYKRHYNGLFNSHQVADYWLSELTMDDIVHGQNYEKYSTFKYAGPGGSIIDANLWNFRHQLMRLELDLKDWSKIDDIWISYVMDALLGWELRRLRPPIVPIDIGHFRKNREFRLEITHNIKLITEQTGAYLMGIKVDQDIKGVGTYLDKHVNKSGVFKELQTKYRWDVYNQFKYGKN